MDETLLKIPATVELMGALLALWVAALVPKCKIMVEEREWGC
jgi:hypothetical protein